MQLAIGKAFCANRSGADATGADFRHLNLVPRNCRSSMSEMESCFCGRPESFAACCEPYLSGRLSPPTAEALMRARYSAFAKADVAYLERTLAPEEKEGFSADETRRWAEGAEWLGFEVLQVEAGTEADSEGVVEFVARYRWKKEERRYEEAARFRRVEGEWYYSGSRRVGARPLRREQPKVGRNDPCLCGSGLKFKKCCGQ